jgi:hypothetical protein
MTKHLFQSDLISVEYQYQHTTNRYILLKFYMYSKPQLDKISVDLNDHLCIQ